MISSQAATYRTLLERIERFVEVLKLWPRDPDRWESEHVLQAARALEKFHFARCERSMIWAELPAKRRSAEALANFKPEFVPLTTKALRARTGRIVRNRSSWAAPAADAPSQWL
ncbi:MAG: hypothetical protein WCK95_23785 [Alphaproteobacteria bacterium]|jgi:hypothetical protein